MQTLSFGYQKPQTGDTQFWNALESNIQRTNDHSHNGVDSTKLSSLAIEAVSQNILKENWQAHGTGFRQTIVVPAGISLSKYGVLFKNSADGSSMFLGIEQISNTSYHVLCNDNSVDLIAFYVS